MTGAAIVVRRASCATPMRSRDSAGGLGLPDPGLGRTRHARCGERPGDENHDDQDDLIRRLDPLSTSASGSGGGKTRGGTQ